MKIKKRYHRRYHPPDYYYCVYSQSGIYLQQIELFVHQSHKWLLKRKIIKSTFWIINKKQTLLITIVCIVLYMCVIWKPRSKNAMRNKTSTDSFRWRPHEFNITRIYKGHIYIYVSEWRMDRMRIDTH